MSEKLGQKANNSEILGRWAGKGHGPAEIKARFEITTAISRDILRGSRNEAFGRDAVDRRTRNVQASLDTFLDDKDSFSFEEKDGDDTKVVEVRRLKDGDDNEYFEVSEKKPDGTVISSADTRGNLTLDYQGEEYKKVNPNIVDSDEYPEAAAKTFELLGKHILKEGSAQLQKEKRVQRMEIIRKSVEEGASLPEQERDKEGEMLYQKTKETFIKGADHPKERVLELGTTVFTYKAARDAVEKIDDPAEMNKALSAVREFYKQMNLGEYTVKIDKKPGEEGYQDAFKQQLKKDFDQMPDQYAHRRLRPYYEKRLRLMEAKDMVSQFVPAKERSKPGGADTERKYKMYDKGFKLRKLPPRDLVREGSLEIQKAQSRVDWAQDNIVDLADDRTFAESFDRSRKGRDLGVDTDTTVWDEVPEEQKGNLIAERAIAFRRQIRDGMGDPAVKAFDNLDDNQRRTMVESVMRREFQIQNAVKRMEAAINIGNTEIIGQELDTAKTLQRDLKMFLAESQITLSAQRTKDAFKDLVSEQKKSVQEGRTILSVPALAGLLADVAKARISEKFQPIKQTVKNVADNVASSAEGAMDKLAQGVTTLDATVDAHIRKHVETSTPMLKSVVDEVGQEINAIAPEVDRIRIKVKSTLLGKLDTLSREWRRTKGILAEEGGAFVRSTELRAEGLSGKLTGAIGKMVGEGEEVFTDVDRRELEAKKKVLQMYRREKMDAVDERIRAEEGRKDKKGNSLWKEAEKYLETEKKAVAQESSPQPEVPGERKEETVQPVANDNAENLTFESVPVVEEEEENNSPEAAAPELDQQERTEAAPEEKDETKADEEQKDKKGKKEGASVKVETKTESDDNLADLRRRIENAQVASALAEANLRKLQEDKKKRMFSTLENAELKAAQSQKEEADNILRGLQEQATFTADKKKK